MDAATVKTKRILQDVEEAKSPDRILLRSLLKSRNKLRAKYRELRAECKRWRNQATAVERSRSTWHERALAQEASAQEDRAARAAAESQLQHFREQSEQREVELIELRERLAALEGAEKGALNQPEDRVVERMPAVAIPIAALAESATAFASVCRADSLAGNPSQLLVPVVAMASPASQEREHLVVAVPARSTVASPVGGRWPGWYTALMVHLVTAIKLSLRSTPRVLEALVGFLGGRAADATVMAWTTVRCWLMRLGLHALRRPLERAEDWAYLIDHTIQIGSVKCFAVVGIRLSRLPYPERCLRREDLDLIALEPMAHSTAVRVEQALENAAIRTGVPRLIVSDEGGDVRGGIERYCGHHCHTAATCDTAHKGANLLRKLLEADPQWAGFLTGLGQTKVKVQQTPLACCAGPTVRLRARFMNLAAPLRWARWCLRALDRPWPTDEELSDRQQRVLATIDREQLEEKFGWLREYRQAIEQWSQWHEVIQVVVRQVRRHGIDRDSVARLRRQFDEMNLSLSGRDAAEVMMTFVAEQAWAARLGGERLIGSTEILESIFGDLKTLERQQSESGFSGLMLAVGAMVSRWTIEEINEALGATPWKAVQQWTEHHVGPTVQAQRRTLQTIFANP